MIVENTELLPLPPPLGEGDGEPPAPTVIGYVCAETERPPSLGEGVLGE